jgi:CelD/BcsL family acetyltransferase involved in cellulose biosynthesis
MKSGIVLKKVKNIQILHYSQFDNELQNKWETLQCSQSVFIFQRYSWNKYWAQIFIDLYYSLIIVIERDEIPVAIFPFCVNRNGFVKILQFIGGNQADYLTPILADNYELSQKEWEAILGILKKEYDFVLLDKIPESIKERKNPFVNVIPLKQSGYSYGIKLPCTYSEFGNTLKRHFLNDNRRNTKRLNELGIVEFKRIPSNRNNIDDFSKYIRIAIEQKARRLRNYLGVSILESEYVQAFYKNSYLLEDTDYHLDFTILTLNGNTTLATHWGFYDNDRFYFLFPTMEGKEWYKYSCGKVLTEFLIQFSISKGNKYFDFTIGGEEYKKNWTNHEMQLFTFHKARSLRGLLYLLFISISEFIRRNRFARYVWKTYKTFMVQIRKRK